MRSAFWYVRAFVVGVLARVAVARTLASDPWKTHIAGGTVDALPKHERAAVHGLIAGAKLRAWIGGAS